MPKTLFWKVKTGVEGVEKIVFAKDSVKDFAREMGTLPNKASAFRNSMVALSATTSVINGLRDV